MGRFDADESGPAPLKPAQFASLGDEGANRSPSPIQVFDLIGRACRTRQVLDEELDLLARALHDNYREPLLQALEECEKQPLKLRDWDELSEDLRDSNRYQADFLPVKLRLLGYHYGGGPAPPQQPAILRYRKTGSRESRRGWSITVGRRNGGWPAGPGPPPG